MTFALKGPIVAGARETTGQQSVTLQTGYATGDVVVVWAATKATGTVGETTAVSVTDSKGNSYVRAMEFSRGAIFGAAASIFYAEVTAGLVSGDTVSLGISSGLSQFQAMAVGGFTKQPGSSVTLQAATGRSQTTITATAAISGQPANNYLWLYTVALRQSATPAAVSGGVGAPSWALSGATDHATGTTGGTSASGILAVWNYALTGAPSTGNSVDVTGLINGGNSAVALAALREVVAPGNPWHAYAQQ